MQEKRKFRTRAVFLILVWILLLALSLALLTILLSLFAVNPQGQSVSSLSWAGYIIAKNSANPQLEVNAINASWITPKLNVSAGDGYSSAWIGIGGQFDKTLIQVGTEHDVVNG
ncbi:MAG: G1 family glutamic endopeptidase [Candidatus Bathyarchaeia archaeon]